MNAHKFVAEHGIDKAKRVLNNKPHSAEFFNITGGYDRKSKNRDFNYSDIHVNLGELKQVVESVEIIDRWKGLKNCKDIIGEATSTQLPPEKSFAARMIKAIADYELVESYKSSNGQTINHYFVSDFKENETLDHLSIKQNSQVEILDMVDVSPNCEVRNG